MLRVLLVMLISLVITGCGTVKVNPGQTVDYREVYKEAIGFSMSGAGSIRPTPPAEDVYLFEDSQSWEKFKNTYFNNIPVPEVKVPKDKILFAQINWPEPLSGSSFRVIGLEISGNKLTVKVKPNSDGIEVSPAARDLFFKYVIILAVDGKTIPGGLKPQLEVSKKDPVSKKPNPDEIPAVEHSIDGFSSAVDGYRLVINDNKTLKVFDLTSGKVVKTISVPPYGVQGFDIYEDMVVWSDLRNEKKDLAQLGSIDPANADIFTYNLKTGELKQITKDPSAQIRPRIWRNYLVWQDNREDKAKEYPGEWDIYLYNLDTGEEKRITSAPGSHTNPEIGDNKVVWEDGRNFKGDRGLRAGGNVPENNTDIYLYDIKEGKELAVATGSLQESEPFVSGNYVVWTDRNNKTFYGDIFLYDLGTEMKRQITKDKFNQSSPKIHGDFLVWMDERRGIATNDVFINGKAPNADIFMYNLKTNRERLMTGDEVQLEPNISANWLVFTLSRQVDPKIQAVRYK